MIRSNDVIPMAAATGVTDHALLTNLNWMTSGHTGTPNMAAYFDGSGNAFELSLGGMALQNANAIAVTGGTITGLTNLGVAMANNTAMTGFSLGAITDTTSRPFNITQTWNNAGLTATAALINVTDTTSNAASRLLALQVAGVNKFEVIKSGNVQITSASSANSIIFTNSSGSATLGASGSSLSFTFSGGQRGWMGNVSGGSGFQLYQDDFIGWAVNGNLAGNAAFDAYLAKGGAGLIDQRNGINAQAFRVFGTFTDTSNYVRLSLACSSTIATLVAETAGTGADDIDLALTPAGAGLVMFGTHSAVGIETVTGFLTVKDSAGNSRKLAVIS